MTQLPNVAKKVYYPCNKCETDRYQVVTAHTGPTSARLECEVCKTKNTFKLEEPKRPRVARATVPKKKPSGKSKAASHVAKWTSLRDANSAKPEGYNMKKEFEVGAALEHPKFGLGFVVNSNVQAIQVIFEDEERSLVHNRT
ncbi:MAG TPA: hypothetical protein PKC28_10660 [Bdellovibrionales bacterium]|nr:hypothetical protein [Bdellovibrionales bacterium]